MMYKILNNIAQVDFGRLHKTQEPKVRAPTKRETSTFKTACSSSVLKELSKILIPATNHPGLE